MTPKLIFELVFLVGAVFGLGGHLAGKPWGVPVALGGLILFGIILVIP
jgi:hypothetical protein